MEPELRNAQRRNDQHADGRRAQDGRGVFHSQEQYQGRTILVRFTMFAITADAAQSEQAFPDDGGMSWETNWINRYTRSQ